MFNPDQTLVTLLQASVAAGASDYITKPVDLDELIELMARWVNADETTEPERG